MTSAYQVAVERLHKHDEGCAKCQQTVFGGERCVQGQILNATVWTRFSEMKSIKLQEVA